MAQDITYVGETLTVQSKATINASATLSLTSGASLAGVAGVPSGSSISLASGASLSLAAGANLVTPSLVNGAPGTASVSVATANNTTIPIAQGIVRASATAATTSGSCTLAAGSVDGQEVTIVNECASNIVISGNMKGSAALTITPNNGQRLVWVSADTVWFPV